MWYAIIGAAGLALGLGLMIWALRERSKRHAAEKQAIEALDREGKATRVAADNARAAKDVEAYNTRLEAQVNQLRDRLDAARLILGERGSDVAVKKWLDEELEGETL
jgi:hypothetical protein